MEITKNNNSGDEHEMDTSTVDCEMESVNGNGQSHPPGKRGRSARENESSTTSISLSMVLSWYDITAKPRRTRSLIPFASNIRAIFDGSANELHKSEPKFILKNVFGVAYPGEVLALMGASGAGKTSLLNLLTQRNLSTVNAVSKTICLNGVEVNKHVLRKIAAYVQQDDLFLGTMTVLEHLRFMALMRMGKHYSACERERRVQNVMADLGLTHCAHTVIGWPHRLKGLSGGERKRLAFASEIMTGPPILFCDEPTSGLDSYLAQQVIQVLKDLARRKNMTIVVTIHQPSSQVFEMFDKICLLADGKLAFLGTIPEAINFFDGLGFPLPENFNPADHFISTLAIEPGKLRKSKALINNICQAFVESDLGKELMESARGGSGTPSIEGSGSDAISIASSELTSEQNSDKIPFYNRGSMSYNKTYGNKTMQRFKSTWFQQFVALTKRSFNVTLREPMLLKVRLFQTVLIGLLLGIIYFQTNICKQTVMNINGLLFQAIANANFMFQFAAVQIFCDELPIFMREHLSNLYRVDAYFLAKNTAELAQYLLYPIIFSTIVYWMAGFVNDWSSYLLFMLSCVLVTNVGVSFSYAAACIFGTLDVAIAVMPVVVIPLLAFGGFYIAQESLPIFFYPLKFISYFGYGFETAAISQWSRVDNISDCYNATLYCDAAKYGNNNDTTGYKTQCYHDGTDVLDQFGFEQENLVFDYVVMCTMIFALRLIAYFAIWLRAATEK